MHIFECAGVGFKMTHQLRGMGITTVQQLRKFSEKELLATFGAANGHMLAQLALCVALRSLCLHVLCVIIARQHINTSWNVSALISSL